LTRLRGSARIKDHALRKVYAIKVDRWLGLMDEEMVLQRIGGAHRDGTRRKPGDKRGGQRGVSPVRELARTPPIGTRAERSGRALRPARSGDQSGKADTQAGHPAPALLGLPSTHGAEVFHRSGARAARELIAGCGGVATAVRLREWIDRCGAAPNDNARMFRPGSRGVR